VCVCVCVRVCMCLRVCVCIYPSKVNMQREECVMSHTWMRHVTNMNESCHAYVWVMSHLWMRCVTHMNDSCHTYGWVMSYIWMSHVTNMEESCHTYEWVVRQKRMSHAAHISESCHTHIWVTSRIGLYVLMGNESCHTYEWVMSHVWMSHRMLMNEACHTYERVLSHIWTSLVTHMNESCHTYEWFISHIWSARLGPPWIMILRAACAVTIALPKQGLNSTVACRCRVFILPPRQGSACKIQEAFFGCGTGRSNDGDQSPPHRLAPVCCATYLSIGAAKLRQHVQRSSVVTWLSATSVRTALPTSAASRCS